MKSGDNNLDAHCEPVSVSDVLVQHRGTIGRQMAKQL